MGTNGHEAILNITQKYFFTNCFDQYSTHCLSTVVIYFSLQSTSILQKACSTLQLLSLLEGNKSAVIFITIWTPLFTLAGLYFQHVLYPNSSIYYSDIVIPYTPRL